MSDDFSEEPCRMDRRDRWMIVFLVLIFASYCWFTQWRAFGYWADPVIYVEGARSLVEQGMYRHESHAGTPKISLYPPIQSAWLSIPWRLNPSFPENVPWLNGSMIVLACGTLAVGFVFLRRAGLPVGLCAGLTFNWAISASWNAFIYWLSSDIGFTGWCVGLGLLWLTPKLSTNTRWWLTGIGLALGYWWRSAALGLIAGTGLVTLWIAIRHRRFLPLIAITVPVLVAGLGWKQLAGPGPGYASIWKVLIADMGGWGGYALNFFSNLFQLGRGTQFWEMLCAPVVRCAQLAGDRNPILGALVWTGLAVGFWVFMALVMRGVRRDATLFSRASACIAVVYGLQVILPPLTSVHWHRYFYLLQPWMWVWAWRGLSDSWRNRIVQPPWSGVLLSLLVISLSLNAYKSRNDRRFAETWLPVVEIQEVALWAKGNLHPESRIAIDFRLPAVHFRAALGRPIWVDVFHPTARTSPIAIVGAGQERPTYVVLATRGAEIYAPPTGWRMVFASHGPNGAMGVFQLYEVRE